jgi:hypothetical protein
MYALPFNLIGTIGVAGSGVHINSISYTKIPGVSE